MTEEQKKKYFHEYYLRNKEKLKAKAKEYAEKNRDIVREKERNRYQKNKEQISERSKKYYQEHKEKIKERVNNYYAENKEDVLRSRRETQMGRANNLVTAYNQQDKIMGRGKGDLTAKWVVENIFSKPCAHCGKTGWQVIGCNRLDNSKPHTMDNVEPCCFDCNISLAVETVKMRVGQYTLCDELVKIWESASEAGRNGFNQRHINACCNGKRKTHKNHVWKYV